MTLPSIETFLRQRGLTADNVSEHDAKQIVFDAIETDLAGGVAYLAKFRNRNWDTLLMPEECCLHCEVKDIATRKQVVRLAAYTPLRAYVREKLGLQVALHNFRPTSSDGGPSARLVIEPVRRKLFAGELPVSAARSWQVMNWGDTPKPPELVDEAVAARLLWQHAEAHLSEGLDYLRGAAATDARVDADGALIPELIQLIGVPGMHAVVAEQLGRSFTFYNCGCGKSRLRADDTTVLNEVSFCLQLQGQANHEMMDC